MTSQSYCYCCQVICRFKEAACEFKRPRYFDPPDSSWETCYNCGEEGHRTRNCTAAKRKKPCFVCGSIAHNAKQCAKACTRQLGCGHKTVSGNSFYKWSREGHLAPKPTYSMKASKRHWEPYKPKWNVWRRHREPYKLKWNVWTRA